MKRPISLLIVAAYFLWAGIRAFLHHNDNPISNDTVSVAIKLIMLLFVLFISIGLLLRVRAARICGLVLIGAGIIGALYFTIWDLSHLQSLVVIFYGVRLDNNPHPPASALAVAFYMFTIIARDVWVFWVLMRRDVRELFQRKTNSLTPTI
ncbi:MAG TPA: hypothetical protein VIK35_11195 [Verrucomicrobiae bacterium]